MKPDWVTKLEAEACACTICTACGGRSRQFIPFWDDGREEDFEPCYQCGGTGIEEECDRCVMLRDYDYEAQTDSTPLIQPHVPGMALEHGLTDDVLAGM